MNSTPISEKRALRILALGALVGLALAAVGLLRDAEVAALPGFAVARVGDTLIAREDFLRLVTGYEEDTRHLSDATSRAHILERMIEEELLIQRAVDLDLTRLDRKVRGELVAILIRSVVADAEGREPDHATLTAHYEENRDYFTNPGRVRARQIFFRVRPVQSPAALEARRENRDVMEIAARARADAARKRILAGDDWNAVASEFGDVEVAPLPSSLLPAKKLREYLGPTATRSTLALEVGAISVPVRSGMGIHIIQLLERARATTLPFDEIRDQVESDWRRRLGDRVLRSYIDDLRANADVMISAEN